MAPRGGRSARGRLAVRPAGTTSEVQSCAIFNRQYQEFVRHWTPLHKGLQRDEKCDFGSFLDGCGGACGGPGGCVDQCWRARLLWADQHWRGTGAAIAVPATCRHCPGATVHRRAPHLPEGASWLCTALEQVLRPIRGVWSPCLLREKRLVFEPLCSVLPGSARAA